MLILVERITRIALHSQLLGRAHRHSNTGLCTCYRNVHPCRANNQDCTSQSTSRKSAPTFEHWALYLLSECPMLNEYPGLHFTVNFSEERTDIRTLGFVLVIEMLILVERINRIAL